MYLLHNIVHTYGYKQISIVIVRQKPYIYSVSKTRETPTNEIITLTKVSRLLDTHTYMILEV